MKKEEGGLTRIWNELAVGTRDKKLAAMDADDTELKTERRLAAEDAKVDVRCWMLVEKSLAAEGRGRRR